MDYERIQIVLNLSIWNDVPTRNTQLHTQLGNVAVVGRINAVFKNDSSELSIKRNDFFMGKIFFDKKSFQIHFGYF